MAGFPGRPPKPATLKIIQGNPGRRPINVGEFQPEVSIPECPSHLCELGRAEWARITPILERAGLISEADMAACALYCDSYALWQRASAEVARLREGGSDGLLVKAPSGYPIQNPYLAIANKAKEQVYQFLQQFGLSPSSRARVTVSNQLALFPDDAAAGRRSYFD